MRAFVFPGQGSQFIGMSQDFHDQFSVAKAVFEAVSDSLSKDFSKIIFEGSIEDLNQTQTTQVAIMTASLAIYMVIKEEYGEEFFDDSLFAGHSLGEYSALTASSSIDIATCAKLLDARGSFMQQAQPLGAGSMAAVIGLGKEQAYDLLKQFKQENQDEIASSNEQVIDIANDNSAKQWVFSGSSLLIDKFIEFAKDFGDRQQIRRLKVVKLAVSAPFHCSLMQPAQDKMSEVLKQTTISDSKYPIVANYDACANDKSEKIRFNLINQITSRVLWRDTINYFFDKKISHQIEIGPGKVLTNLLKRSDKPEQSGEDYQPIAISVSSVQDLANLKVLKHA